MKKNTLLLFRIVILSFFLMDISLNIIAKNLFLNKNLNGLIIHPKDIKSDTNTLNYRLMKSGDPNIQSFSTIITKNDLKKLGDSNYQIIINNLNCQAYKVYFNNICLGAIGDFKNGNSNIKNALTSFFLDKNLVKDTNEFKIETFSLYEVGLGYLPIVIYEQSTANFILNWFNLVISTTNTMSISVSFLGFIILFYYYILNKDKSYYLYLAASFIFMLFSLPEFITIYSMPFSYIAYKKISLISTYLSVSLISFFLYKIFNDKICKFIALFTTISILLACVLSKDLITFKTYYRILNIVLPINCFIWLYTCKKNLSNSHIAKIFYCNGYLGLIFLTYQIFSIFRKDLCIINSSLLYSIFLTGSAIIMVYYDYANKKIQIEHANLIHLELYEKSIRDSMTGLYNHNYIISIMQDIDPLYYAIIIDIDDFKSINDTHGHLAGDDAVRFIANKLNSIIGNPNIIARYGGDEFFIILYEKDLNTCIRIVNKLYKSLESAPFIYNGTKISLTLSSGLYKVEKKEPTDVIISKADNALYRSKNSGKNKLSIYSSNI